MLDIIERLKEFESACIKLETQEFVSFREKETIFCELINEGNALRKEILATPGLCDENSLLVLTNKSRDLSLLAEKFKGLLYIPKLATVLFESYTEGVDECLANQDYMGAIGMYEQLFKFTNNYFYKKQIANIHFRALNNYELSLKMYRELIPYLGNDKEFWWQFSDIYREHDVYNCVMCIKNATDLELKEMEGNANA